MISLGRPTNDVFDGTDKADIFFGFNGDDTIWGLDLNDHLFGNAGSDILFGGDGRDYLSGGAGNDWLFGEAGNDTINGGRGNDVLIGGDGNDTLRGGPGHDIFSFTSQDMPAPDTIRDFAPGVDHISIDGGRHTMTVAEFSDRISYSDDAIMLDGKVIAYVGDGLAIDHTSFFV